MKSPSKKVTRLVTRCCMDPLRWGFHWGFCRGFSCLFAGEQFSHSRLGAKTRAVKGENPNKTGSKDLGTKSQEHHTQYAV